MQAFYNSSIINILKVKDQTLDTNIPNKSLINQRHDMGPVCLTGFSSFVQLEYLGSWYLYFCVDHLKAGFWLLAWFHKIPFCPCRMFTQALSRPVKGGGSNNGTKQTEKRLQIQTIPCGCKGLSTYYVSRRRGGRGSGKS